MVEKDKLIQEFSETRRKIIDLACSLSSKKLDEVFLGSWSVKDILTHLAGWDYWNLKAVKEILRGTLPSFYSYFDPDWASFNAQLIKKYKKENFKKLLYCLKRSHRRLTGFLQTIPAEEFGKDKGLWWGSDRVTIAGGLEIEIRGEKMHYRQIREMTKKWRGKNG